MQIAPGMSVLEWSNTENTYMKGTTNLNGCRAFKMTQMTASKIGKGARLPRKDDDWTGLYYSLNAINWVFYDSAARFEDFFNKLFGAIQVKMAEDNVFSELKSKNEILREMLENNSREMGAEEQDQIKVVFDSAKQKFMDGKISRHEYEHIIAMVVENQLQNLNEVEKAQLYHKKKNVDEYI